jgi:SAM-dependent methyltransferase
VAGVIERLTAVVAAPVRAARFLFRGERQLGDVRELARDIRKDVAGMRKAVADAVTNARRASDRLDKDREQLTALQRDIDAVRQDVSDQLRQTNLQLNAVMRVVQQLRASTDGHGGNTTATKLSGRAVPLTVNAEEPHWSPVIGGEIHPDPDGREWLSIDRCPFCGHDERTVVVEWNKLIMLAKAPDQQSARYNYSCCHRCGVVYAARRPCGQRFLFLLQHFGEVTGKAAADGILPNPLLNPYPLSDKDKEQLRRMAAHGVWVSEHLGLKTTEYLEGVLKDRFENSVHVDLLANLVKPANARVLEIRPRAGTIAESLRRLYNADVSVMPMWESQKFLLKELYGFDAQGLIDYDHFHIPFEGRFDLIVCNHILVHSVRPAEFLREVHAHLKPGGYVYLYNEPEDRQVLDVGKSIIAHLNPLHMQTFDRSAMIRALAANGFEVTFIKARNSSFLVLARAADSKVAWTPIPPARLTQRIEVYRLARDRAILRLPVDMRQRLGGEWAGAIEHGLASGTLEFDDQGQLRFAAE